MAQVFHFGPYFWASDPGLTPGAQHSWSFGPNPGLSRSGLVATAHPEPGIDQPIRQDRRLTVAMIQSHRTVTDQHFVHIFVRNVGSQPVGWYSLWLSAINP